MKKDDTIYLEHILQALTNISEYTKGLSKEAFLRHNMAQDAVIRQFEVIGEATKRLSTEIRSTHSHIPWKDMAGMRDKLIHDYIDVDIWVVWKTVEKDVPELQKEISKLIG